jgi:hypothetical protein
VDTFHAQEAGQMAAGVDDGERDRDVAATSGCRAGFDERLD